VSELFNNRQNRRRPRISAPGQFVETLENRQLMSLTVDLRLPGGAKSATVSTVGQKISLEVWATIKGSNTSTADDGVQQTMGSLLSTNLNGGAANGTLAVTLAAPFNGAASVTGDKTDLDGDGDLDVGSNDNSTDIGFFQSRADTMMLGPTFKIGTATFTVTSLKSTTGQTNLVFRGRKVGTSPVWREDGMNKRPLNGGVFNDGTPVVLKRGGTVTTYSLAGNVFTDTDGDGIKDTGEVGRSGVKVYIDKDKDGILDVGEKTATTNTSGNYTFTGLATGSTRIRIVTPTGGYRVTTPSSGYHDFTLTGNTSGKNFGVSQRVLITGRAWIDSDKDGVKDSAEVVLAGWRVYIDKDKDGRYDAGEPTVLTDSSGNYSFKSLTAGTYRVRIVQPTGYTRISPTSGYFERALTNGQTWSNNNFRFTKP
jgi:hypothetical protein